MSTGDRTKTHCKNGHALTAENVVVRLDSRKKPYRQCRTCQLAAQRTHRKRCRAEGRHGTVTREKAEKVISLLREGHPLSHITKGVIGRKGKYVPGLFVVDRYELLNFCKANHAFEKIISTLIEKNRKATRGGVWQTKRVAAPAIMRSNGDAAFTAINDATRSLPPMIRGDIQGEMFLAIAEGRLSLADIPKRVREFVQRMNRSDRQSVFNPWGHLSLEKPVSEDGSLKLIDVIREDQRLWG